MYRIKNQEPDHRRVALKTLAWVSYAFRPLSLRELQHALAIEPGDTDLDEELIMDGHSITSLCAGLVVVDHGTNQVNLVHHSTKHYFEDIRHVQFPNFHSSITLSCATYLTLKPLAQASIWEIVQSFPLACYAAQYMGDHARLSPEEALEPSIIEVLCQLLSHPSKRKPLLALLDGLDLIRAGFYSSKPLSEQTTLQAGANESAAEGIQLTFETAVDLSSSEPMSTAQGSQLGLAVTPRSERSFSISTVTSDSTGGDDYFPPPVHEQYSWENTIMASRIPEVTALHLAASMGLAKVASMLLKQTPNIDAVDETGKTALTVAMERGFEKAVEFLVNSGASVDLRSDHGQSVLLLVTERDWHNIADTIAEGALSDIRRDSSEAGHFGLRFLLGAYYNSSKQVQKLIRTGVLNLKEHNSAAGKMALFLAVERQHAEMVQTILDAGVDVDAKDNIGQTSLHRATRRENQLVMKVLLQHNATVDSKDDEGRTAWSAHARTRNTAILSLLLEAGADPSTTTLQGISPLYTAAQEGDTETVRFLLNAGTDPSIQTQYDWAPLHWAAAGGHTDCVKLLIEAGADLSPVSDQEVTPLNLAFRANQVAVVDQLIRAGAKRQSELDMSSSTAIFKIREQDDGWVDVDTAAGAPEDTGQYTSKTMLVFDKPLGRAFLGPSAVGQFVYPPRSKNPIEHVYELSHFLETATSSISVKRASPQTNMAQLRTMWHRVASLEQVPDADDFASEDALYDIVRVRAGYQELELRGKHQTALPGVVSMHKDWTGGWKVRHSLEGGETPLFRTTPEWSKTKAEQCRWVTEDGTLLARTGAEDATPNLCFEHGPARQQQDLIVCCWIAKLWCETVASSRRESVSAGS